MASFAEAAPFLFNNWQLILLLLVTVVLGSALWSVLSSGVRGEKNDRTSSKDGAVKKITSFDKGEHPLAEFDDEKPDPSFSPALHSPDTPHVDYRPERLTEGEMLARSRQFYETLNKRR